LGETDAILHRPRKVYSITPARCQSFKFSISSGLHILNIFFCVTVGLCLTDSPIVRERFLATITKSSLRSTSREICWGVDWNSSLRSQPLSVQPVSSIQSSGDAWSRINRNTKGRWQGGAKFAILLFYQSDHPS
jgi:hypothetical protein